MYKPLIPRLNYKYSLRDALISLSALIKNNIDRSELNDLFDSKYIYFVNHGRTGIRIALTSLGLSRKGRIGVQAVNCHTVYAAIKRANLNPIFIDVNEELQIDLQDLKRKKDQIDALIVTHLFGVPADIDAIRFIIGDKPIIEDCAHSFLSKYKGRMTGTIGDIGVFSIGKGKFPSIGSGGFIVVNNRRYINKIHHSYSILGEYNILSEVLQVVRNIILSVFHTPFIYGVLTYSFIKKVDRKYDISGKHRFKENKIYKVNKYLLLKNLLSYNIVKNNQKGNARKIISEYDINSLVSIYNNSNNEINYFILPCLVKEGKDKHINTFNRNGVEIGGHFSNSILWAKSFGYQEGCCPNAEMIVKSLITIPTYTEFHKIENIN
jgi:perosamine synthetase